MILMFIKTKAIQSISVYSEMGTQHSALQTHSRVHPPSISDRPGNRSIESKVTQRVKDQSIENAVLSLDDIDKINPGERI